MHQDRHHDDAKASSASSLSVVKSDATCRLFAEPATAEVHSGSHFYFEGKVKKSPLVPNFPFWTKLSKHVLTVHRHHDDAKASSASSLSVVKSDATSWLFAEPATAEVYSDYTSYLIVIVLRG